MPFSSSPFPLFPSLTLVSNRFRLLLSSLALVALATAGCDRTTEDAATTEMRPPAQTPSAAAAVANREFWDLQQIGDVRVGYARTSVRPTTTGGHVQVQIEGLSRMKFRRAGQSVEMEVQYGSTETPDGRLLAFQCKIAQGPVVIQQTDGRVEGDQLRLATTTMGKTTTSSLPWSPKYGGLLAGEQSLWQAPMKPGETRSLTALLPGFNQVGQVQLVAREWEPVEILGKTSNLLRIDMTTTFSDGQSHGGTLWTDSSGEILRRHEAAMNLVSVRVPKEVALAQSDQAPFDLVLGLSVNVDRPIPHPHDTKQLRYVLHLDGGDPAAVFPSGSSQEITSLGPHEARATVYAVRPDQPGNPHAPADPPREEDRQANNLIQSDNPAIVAMAKQVAPEEKDPWRVAVALEKYVKDYITSSDYSQAFATAAQVAASRTGDCTEHAVLLAALARARGIPARVAVGLVYTEQTGQPAFGYHMWTEVSIDGRWIPLDATLGRGGIGAAHLKLAHSNLAAASAFSSLLPVAQVAGRLRISGQ